MGYTYLLCPKMQNWLLFQKENEVELKKHPLFTCPLESIDQ